MIGHCGVWVGMCVCHSCGLPVCRDLDFGVPMALCNETAFGVFTRPWSNAVVTLDCNTFTADLGL